MKIEEKAIARILFQNKLHKANGQKFEDIFTAILNYAESDFQQIKPWGCIGDRKCDGYIRSKAIFYQVFAPEEIGKSYVSVVAKIENDFNGLVSQWNPVNEFYFVINDKYLGVNADCEQKLQKIKSDNNLLKTGFLTAKDLENLLFELSDDQIFLVVGFLPDPIHLKTVNYSILNEVIEFVMKSPLSNGPVNNITVPDWDEKIKFNQLSSISSNSLNNGYLQIGALENYLKNNGKFLATELQKRLYQIYHDEKIKNKIGDDLFWAVVTEASPKAESMYQAAVIVLMAKYFESCDIFEDPAGKNKK
jgi:hypothetical protein